MHRIFPLLLLILLVTAPLHAGVLKIGTLHIEDAVPLFLAEREVTFRYDGGLVDYVNHINTGSRAPIHRDVIYLEREDPASGMSLELAMQWNASFSESVHTFANTINTHEGGTHEEGFRAALTNTVNRWGAQWGMIKKPEDKPSGEDIREGLTAIISVKIS